MYASNLTSKFLYEYMVLVVTLVEPHRNLKEYSQTPCTGTLIRNDLVLTAATCLQMNTLEELDPSSTEVFLRDGSRLRSLKIFVHYQYSKSHVYNFAVIVVEKSNIYRFPQLPTINQAIDFVKIRNSCVLGGYGDQQMNISPSKFSYTLLNESAVNVIKCRQRHKVEHVNRLCLHFRNMQPCPGDVGSPLVCGGELVAIFTPRFYVTSKSCVDRYGSVFTPVPAIMDWVNKIVSTPSANLKWMNNPWYVLLLCSSTIAVIGSIYYILMEIMQKTFPMDHEEEPRPTNNGEMDLIRPFSENESKDDKWRWFQNHQT